MLPEDEFAVDLAARFGAQVAILYGSAARGGMQPDSDVDVVCFVAGTQRGPATYRWRGYLIDAWIHPHADAERPEELLKLHDGRILFDHEQLGEALLSRIASRVRAMPALDPRHESHLRTWAWKMLDRAARSGPEADHRRHWLLGELPQLWCELTRRHYLGCARTLTEMQSESPPVYLALAQALRPGASLPDVERAVLEIVGPRD